MIWHMEFPLHVHQRKDIEAAARERFRATFSVLTPRQHETVSRFLAWTREMQEEDEMFPAISEWSLKEFWLRPT